MRKEHKTILIAMPNKGTKGGPQGHLPYLVESLEQKGHKLIQVSYGQKKDNENIFWKAISNIVSIRRLRQILKNNSDIDIIHINSAFDTKALIRDTLTVIFILKYSKPIFIKFHGSDKNLTETKNYILRFLQNKLYKFIDGMGVLSSEERKNFIKAGVDVSKIFIVKNIVKPELYKKNDGSLNENNFNYHNIILYISRFIENKGLLDVIEACKLLKENNREFILLCLGDGPIRKSAENNVRMYGLEGKVKFLGYIPEEETHEYYSNSDFIVFPTYHQEGFPMAIFRSLAAGLPIITTKIRAAADYLKEPDNCLWVEPKNTKMISEKMMYLIDNPELRNNMSKNNRELSTQFSSENITNEFIIIYNKILNNYKKNV